MFTVLLPWCSELGPEWLLPVFAALTSLSALPFAIFFLLILRLAQSEVVFLKQKLEHSQPCVDGLRALWMCALLCMPVHRQIPGPQSVFRL